MTTGWGAPRDAYELARDMAAGDSAAEELLWKRLGARQREGLILALGAQARLAAAIARTAGTPCPGLDDLPWDSIACAEVRAFARAAYASPRPVPPRSPCGRCLRLAAGMLAGLHLAAVLASGIPAETLAGFFAAHVARSREPGHSPAVPSGPAVREP